MPVTPINTHTVCADCLRAFVEKAKVPTQMGLGDKGNDACGPRHDSVPAFTCTLCCPVQVAQLLTVKRERELADNVSKRQSRSQQRSG